MVSTSDPGSATKKLIASTASGTTLLILVQVASRAFTFTANQLVLRKLSPTLLGISNRLELYSTSIVYFSRESIRNAIQRQPLEASGVDIQGQKGEDKAPGIDEKKAFSSATQSVINISYLSIVLGVPLSLLATKFYTHFVLAEILHEHSTKSSLFITGIGSLIELSAEPFFAVIQQHGLYKTRALVETVAAFTKSFSICGIVMWSSWAGYDVGVIPFAAGYLGYSLAIICGYSITMLGIATERRFSFLPSKIKSDSDPRKFIAGLFSRRLLLLAASVFMQATAKHLLTQGDSIILAAMASLEDEGIYALAANYGSLIARIVFQPIEESSRNLFASLLTRGENDTDDPACIQAAKDHLAGILQAYGLVSIIVFPLGPIFVTIVLNTLVGRQWALSNTSGLFSLYSCYIPFLAVNGITEAFVSAASSPSELRRHASRMAVFSACFALAAFVFLKLLGLGSPGLILANIVNMAVRIIWSSSFIRSYFHRKKNDLAFAQVSQSTYTYTAATIATSVMVARRKYFTENLHGYVEALALGVIYVLVILCFEKQYLMEQYNRTRQTIKLMRDKTQ
ncbi:hypothetical protein ASPZODRAFT_136554 [Penicilliopsis zonata CBS 506.65]|uniref:Man(5)GlcNAc(2)-PP-dolichol translocation protein RFT1 n=1 Tax=Penicilliopsis zonata CBS 506.65 TaxID=1073090 RepID=A0A1L9S842_9EURO|nr:hypothetical protein ASPZODRAFT_136554 [Penicilliopsis zonata CBS 506.65]OJJ43325.1 hypothetical protein ASPZODRAFT_136554 [Penicilliopsis zonata CBS 506.65]